MYLTLISYVCDILGVDICRIHQYVYNRTMTFNYRGFPFVEEAFATIEQKEGYELHGVLHRMTKSDFIRLIQSEGIFTYTLVNIHSH